MDLEFRPHRLTEAEISALRFAASKDLRGAAIMLSGRVKITACVHDGRVVGHCTGNTATGEIRGLSVNHGYRRQGIARRLLALVVDAMLADGAQRIWLAAPRNDSLPAYHFYRALGWEPTGEHASDGDEILELPLSRRSD